MSRVPLAGVIGAPVGHSRSPRLHGHWLAQLGLPGHYVPLHVEPEDLAAVLRTLPKAGFVGANVTIPHKEAALALADRATDRARRIGAANTLTFAPDGTLEADNTDGHGFVANIRQAAPGWAPAAGPAAVYGAGGAARAVIAALLDLGVPELRLANRSQARAEALAAAFGPRVQVRDWDAPIARDALTLVNTTSLGMAGAPPFDRDLRGLAPGAIANDLVYVPLRTAFLAAAEAQGAQPVDGLGMLLHQAVPGFERWFGRRPEVTEALRRAVLG